MKNLDPEVRTALGLDDDARLDRQDRYVAARSAEGRGLAAASPLEAVVAAFLKAPHVAEPLASARPGPGRMLRLSREPGVYLVELNGLRPRRSGGAVQALSDEGLVIDARGEACFLRLTGPHATGSQVDVVWHLTADAAELLEVRAAAPATAVPSTASVQEPAQLALTCPPFEALTGGASPAAWLAEAYASLEDASSPVDRAAAVGLLARCHSPRGLAGLSVEQLLALPSALDAARSWRASLPIQTQEALEAQATERAKTLRRSFSDVRDAILSGTPEARAAARAWIGARDRLESVAVLFGQDAPRLNNALTQLDEAVAVHHSIWSELEAWDEDPLLSEVAWREPDAWWGRLSGS